MKQLPKALDRNGDLWVPAATKQLMFRALQDVRHALEATQGLQATGDKASFVIDHGDQLQSLALLQELLGLDRLDRPLPAVHEQLGEPAPKQARLLRNLYKLRPI
jgi:hypothetical protein